MHLSLIKLRFAETSSREEHGVGYDVLLTNLSTEGMLQDGLRSKVEKWIWRDALGCTDGVHNPVLTNTQTLAPSCARAYSSATEIFETKEFCAPHYKKHSSTIHFLT